MSKKQLDVNNISKLDGTSIGIPEQAVALADIPAALPEILTPLLLVDAQLYQYGQLLLIKLASGKILIVKNYFPDAPEQGLPEDIANGEFVAEMFILESGIFKPYLDGLSQTDIPLFNSINNQLEPVVQWIGTVDAEAVSSLGLLGDGLADLPTIQNELPSPVEQPTGNSLYQPPTLPTTTSLDGLGDTDSAAVSAPNASALGSLSTLSLGGLGGGSAQGLSSIGGALGSATSLALAPPSDALASGSSGVELDPPLLSFATPKIEVIGELQTSIQELSYRYGGGLININGTNSTDSINFTDSDNWLHTYSGLKIETTGQSSFDPFSRVSFGNSNGFDLFFNNEPVFYDFSISIAGLDTVNLDLRDAIDFGDPLSQIADFVNSNQTLSDAGITAYWVETTGFITGYLAITDPQNREITAASIRDMNGNDIDTSIANNKATASFEITFTVPDYQQQFPGSTGIYDPDNRHGSDLPVVTQTNITRYTVDKGGDEREDHFTFGGVGNDDFVLAGDFGVRDYDTVSFYSPVAGQEETGNADYDFVTNSAYTKISNISHIEARGSGDNTVLLNQAAVRGMTDISISAANIWSLDISGDAADSVNFTDVASWEYSGIIADSTRTITFFEENDIDIIDHVVTQDLGNIQYQYIAVNGLETYTVNVSADILDHPDWYWSGGTSGDDAYELPDTQFGSVDFGAGVDTLELNSGLVSKTQNFIGEGGDLANVEIINLTNTQSGNATATIDTATVDRSFVTDATDSNNTLSFIGDSVDSVAIADVATDWTFLGSTAGSDGLAGLNFNQYAYRPGEAGEVILNIETELATAIPNYYRGWESDDIINIQAGDFAAIDGGLGRDTAIFATNSGVRELDLTEATTTINNIEIFDMRNSSEENITFDLSGVARAEGDTVFVLGDASLDSVDVTNVGDWSLVGRANFTDAPDTYLYQGSGGEALYVQTNLLQDFEKLALSTEGDDVFRVIDTDFGTLNGAGGSFDRINFLQDGNINLANLSGSSLTSVEVADLTNGVANNLSLTAASIESAASSEQFYILGEAGDSVTLSAGDNWQFQDSIAVSASLTLDSYTSTATGGTTVYVDSQVATSVA